MGREPGRDGREVMVPGSCSSSLPTHSLQSFPLWLCKRGHVVVVPSGIPGSSTEVSECPGYARQLAGSEEHSCALQILAELKIKASLFDQPAWSLPSSLPPDIWCLQPLESTQTTSCIQGLKELGDIICGEIKIIVCGKSNFIPLEFLCHRCSPVHKGLFFTEDKLRQSIVFIW